MDPLQQASFIPKRSLDAARGGGGGVFDGLLFFITLFLFIVSLAAAGGAFAYKNYIQNAIAQQSDSLQKAEAAFDPGAIEDLVRIDARINNAALLLQKHVAPSGLFAFLADQTLQTVQFTSLTYDLQSDGSAKITLAGVANSFSSVALQSDQFNADKVLKNVVFSGIAVDSTGHISFNVSATVDASVLNYAKNLGVSGAVPAAAATTTPATPATTTTQATSSSPFTQ